MSDEQLAKHSVGLRRRKDFSFLTTLEKKFPQAEFFLVGGMVRDILLNRKSKDYDFVISNIPIRTLQTELKKLGRVDLVGKTFGVLKFIPKNSKLEEPIDIALPRVDHAFGTGGYKDVKTQSDPKLSIEEDLLRRDFTINALAFDIKKRLLIDPSTGQKHLITKQLQTVGDPLERFHEDFTRMLRCIRFACQLDFSIEKKTWQTIPKLVHHFIEKRDNNYIVPREVIAQEMIKSYVANPVKAFDLFDQSGITKTLMPELLTMKKCPQPRNFHIEGDVWNHTRLTLEILLSNSYQKQFGDKELTAEVIFGCLFHDLGKPYTIQTPEKDGADRIRFNNHDSVGAEKAFNILKRLSFSVFPKTDTLRHIEPENIRWIVRHHLAGYRNDIDVMREVTVEKYFINEHKPSRGLLRVQHADTAATIHKDTHKPDFTSFKKILKRIDRIKKKSQSKRTAPKRLLSGHEVMKFSKLKSGPQIGKILNDIREIQLTGKISSKKQAEAYVRKLKND